MSKFVGIDVSEWNGEIDWEKVKPEIDLLLSVLDMVMTISIYMLEITLESAKDWVSPMVFTGLAMQHPQLMQM